MFTSSVPSIVVLSGLLLAVAILGQRNETSICDWIQCANGGTCLKSGNPIAGYHCRCQFGFAGLLCEDRVNITTCVTNPCQNNGNCSMGIDRLVQCLCPPAFTGTRCESTIGNRTK